MNCIYYSNDMNEHSMSLCIICVFVNIVSVVLVLAHLQQLVLYSTVWVYVYVYAHVHVSLTSAGTARSNPAAWF